jgi:hypothetical protein
MYAVSATFGYTQTLHLALVVTIAPAFGLQVEA